METVSATEFHDRTAELTEQAMERPESPIVIEKRGKPAVVLMDARYYEGLLETLDLLADPAAMKAIHQGLADLEAGRVVEHDQLARELGFHESQPRPHRLVRPRKGRATARRKSHHAAKNL